MHACMAARALHDDPRLHAPSCEHFSPMCCISVQAAWDESLVITGEDTSQVEDIDDDLSRELAFYNQVCTPTARAEEASSA